MGSDDNIVVTFTNYNYAFGAFFENYKMQCQEISKKTLLSDISDIRKMISTFVYEYEYAIRNPHTRKHFRERLNEIKKMMDTDEEAVRIMNKDPTIMKNWIAHQHKYYEFFLLYLNVLADYAGEMAETFMPRTNVQQKIFRFSNNQTFFERFSQHKKIVFESLCNFGIKDFTTAFNNFITFFYAYHLFINIEENNLIEQLLSNILSIYLNKDNLLLLTKQELSHGQRKELRDTENVLHAALLHCNSLMNQSFSSYDVLPKIREKIYIDRTLI